MSRKGKVGAKESQARSRRIALFTTFFDVTSGYSLVTVAETQIRMLLDHGYDPLVIAVEGQLYDDQDGNPHVSPFEEAPPPSVWNRNTIDLRPVLPAMHLESGVAPDFEQRVKAIYHVLKQNLQDVDVCITHDVVLQEWYKEYNIAMRRYAEERPDLLWLHWIHSCPTRNGVTDQYPGKCRFTSPPGYIIYPNSVDRAQVVRTYRIPRRRVQMCRAGHAIDPLTFKPYHPLTKFLVNQTDFLSGEITAVYPARLDRGKQPEKIIRLMAGVKKAGYEPRLIVADWQSSGEHFQAYKDELLQLAYSYEIGDAVSFTSRLHDDCSQGIPRQVVLELMGLSNAYIHPSRVETYSLVVHEAILCGCLAVLNYDFPVMHELFGNNAIYMDFGSDRVDRTYHPNEQAFWNDEALRLIAELRGNRAVWAKTVARREWTPQALWKEFEPLLYLQPVSP